MRQLLDHMHFQYNGALLGVALLGVTRLARGQFVSGGFLLALLVCTKHLFVVLGPLVALFLLRHYVLRTASPQAVVGRAVVLVGVLAAAVGLSMAPLLLSTYQWRDVPNAPCDVPRSAADLFARVGQRLFPFNERGLLHAYWAPNAWALYAGADLVLARALGRRDAGALTSGLVESHAQQFSVLPNISPRVCAALTLLSMLPFLWRMLKRRRSALHGEAVELFRDVAGVALCAYMFGWHVHEKFIMVALLPLTFTVLADVRSYRIWCVLWAAGTSSLLPLLDPAPPLDQFVAAVLVAVLSSVTFAVLLPRSSSGSADKSSANTTQSRIADWYSMGALFGLPLLRWCLQLAVGSRLPFLPLLATSIYCATGIAAVFFAMLVA